MARLLIVLTVLLVVLTFVQVGTLFISIYSISIYFILFEPCILISI